MCSKEKFPNDKQAFQRRRNGFPPFWNQESKLFTSFWKLHWSLTEVSVNKTSSPQNTKLLLLVIKANWLINLWHTQPLFYFLLMVSLISRRSICQFCFFLNIEKSTSKMYLLRYITLKFTQDAGHHIHFTITHKILQSCFLDKNPNENTGPRPTCEFYLFLCLTSWHYVTMNFCGWPFHQLPFQQLCSQLYDSPIF